MADLPIRHRESTSARTGVMKRISLPVLIVGLALVIALQAAEMLGWLPDLLRPSAAKQAVRNPTDLLCGPKSLHVAANVLGQPAGFDRIMEHCPVSDHGVRFADLQKVAVSLGLKAQFQDLDWRGLIDSACVAICYVDNGHYVTVDARDPKAVRLYDPGRVMRIVEEKDIDKRWLGESLILRPAGIEQSSLKFESLWNDAGYVYGSSHAANVRMENRTTVPIRLWIADIGCSCTSAKIVPETIEPGESASLIGEINLKSKRGLFAEKVVVGSSVDNQLREVWFCGGKLSDALCRIDDFVGEYVDGAEFDHVVYVHDPGEDLLKLNDSNVTVDLAAEGQQVPLKVAVQRVEEKDGAIGKREMFPVRPGDFKVHMTGVFPRLKGAGKLVGSMQITTHLGPPLDFATIKLSGRIVSRVDVVPHAILLADADKSHSATLKLRSKDGKSRVQLIGFRSSIDGLSVTEASSNRSEMQIEVRIPAGSVQPGHPCHIHLQTNEGELPILVSYNNR